MKIQGARSLLTKFFYDSNHLHFQILIQTEDDLEVHGEYSDYKLYKTAFDQIYEHLNFGNRLRAYSEKKLKIEPSLANVA